MFAGYWERLLSWGVEDAAFDGMVACACIFVWLWVLVAAMTDKYQEFIKKAHAIMGTDYIAGMPCPFCGGDDVEELAKYTPADRHACMCQPILFWTVGFQFTPPYKISHTIFRAELRVPVKMEQGKYDGITVTMQKDGTIKDAVACWGLTA